jgi:hypothetical protein
VQPHIERLRIFAFMQNELSFKGARVITCHIACYGSNSVISVNDRSRRSVRVKLRGSSTATHSREREERSRDYSKYRRLYYETASSRHVGLTNLRRLVCYSKLRRTVPERLASRASFGGRSVLTVGLIIGSAARTSAADSRLAPILPARSSRYEGDTHA